MPKHDTERENDAPKPLWVHRGKNRAERREIARKKSVLPPPAINKPYEAKGERP